MSPALSLECRVRQGCPLSCHLFNLVGQVLIYALRKAGFFTWWKFSSDLCSLYADDTSIFIFDLSQLAPILHHIQWVGFFTALSLNLNKTIVLYPWNKNKYLVAGVSVSSEPVKYLGTFLGVGDLTNLNFEGALNKARKVAA